MTNSASFYDGYDVGILQVLLEAHGWRSAGSLADALRRLHHEDLEEERGSGMELAEQGAWWLGYYMGRNAGRREEA